MKETYIGEAVNNAIRSNQFGNLEHLLKFGYQTNEKTLNFAVLTKDINVVKLVVKYGAKATVTSYRIAKNEGQEDIINYIKNLLPDALFINNDEKSDRLSIRTVGSERSRADLRTREDLRTPPEYSENNHNNCDSDRHSPRP